MSLTYDDMDAAVNKKFLPKAVEQIFIGNALLTKLLAKSQVVFDSGRKIAQPIIYGKLAGGSYKGLDTFDIGYKPTQTYAEWDWKSYYVNVTIPGDDLDIAEGDEKIIGLLASKMETATMTAHDDLTSMFFSDGTGNANKDFDGLLNGADSGSLYPTYGGITRTTETWWAGKVDSTGGAVTIDAINAQIGTQTIAQKKPDLAFTTQTIYDKIWARVQPQQRFLDGKSALAQVGFTGINFNGHCEIIVDNHCPGGYIFFLNTDYWKLILNRKRNFSWTPPKTPVDYDAYIRQMITRGNLIDVQPRVSGFMYGLT
jgi:hypothetical protein